MSKRDRVWLGPELSDGNRPFIRETPEGVETGIMGDVLPAPDSVVQMKHVAGCCFEVTSEVRFTASGPSQVATNAYRTGWDRLFGKPREVGQA